MQLCRLLCIVVSVAVNVVVVVVRVVVKQTAAMHALLLRCPEQRLANRGSK